MNKSVYSLVLMDDVVQAIDREAYQLGTSRSNLINQILAEFVSFDTPEKRMKEIFEKMEQLIHGETTFQIQPQPSDAMLSIRSALSYKYKPVIRYAVQLYRSTGDEVGELRVSIRTQSQALIASITRFFTLWAKLEEKYLSRFFEGNEIPYEIDNGRYFRQFLLPQKTENQTNEKIAEAVTEYIRILDHILKIYFANLEDLPTAIEKMEKAYISCLKNGIVVI